VEQISQQFIRALRGARSQVAFARRVGYRGNPITDWECGRSYPTAVETLRCAEKINVDVRAAFTRFSPTATLHSGPRGYALGAWLRQVGGASPTELARRTGRSRSSVSRWLSDTARPRLPEFFELVDAATGRLQDLVAELVDIQSVPALAARYEASQTAKRLAFDAPWTEAILRALETPTYARFEHHDPQWIARILGIEADEVERCLAALLRAGLVNWDGERFDQLRSLNVDTRGGKAALHALKSHWARVAAERAARPKRTDLFAYNVLSASAGDLDKIRAVLVEAFRDIRTIVAASEPPERVALLNIHLIDWTAQGNTETPPSARPRRGQDS
jgi:transcriptional regulator with XRE-family HTH domain